MIYKLLYKLFGLFRYKVITERGLVVTVDVRAIHREYEKEITSKDIDKLSSDFKREYEEQVKVVGEVTNFQRVIELATASQMLELIRLRNEMFPEEIEKNEDLKEHFEKVGQEKIIEPEKKLDRKLEDKRIKKLYIKLVKIYHPDKAPKGKEQEYTEIFKILTAFKDKQDYKGLKDFAKSLKKPDSKSLTSLLKIKFKLLTDLRKLREEKDEFLHSKLYTEFELYKLNPKHYIESQIAEIEISIESLKKQKYRYF